MSNVTRIEGGPRMSQAVVHGDLVYTAGQVALRAPGQPVAAQTKDILDKID
jgi:enamine deaminase RidA (YjgF/YER057c/UK114 family)